MKKNLLIVGIVLAIILIAGLGYGYVRKLTYQGQNPIVTMEVEGYGTIKMELYPDKAPETVANFISLINQGFYDGLIFHRTIPGFMIQGGDENGDGTGSLDYAIKGEFVANKFSQNDLKHERGVISMARADYSYFGLTKEGYNSAGSQFFIVHEDSTSLNKYYAAFGKVIEGMEIVDNIVNLEVLYRSSELAEGEEAPKGEDGADLPSDMPIEPPVITKMTVETFGENYGEPEKLTPFDLNSWFMQQYGY